MEFLLNKYNIIQVVCVVYFIMGKYFMQLHYQHDKNSSQQMESQNKDHAHANLIQSMQSKPHLLL